jgi:hypothetical protein
MAQLEAAVSQAKNQTEARAAYKSSTLTAKTLVPAGAQ